MTSRDNQNPLNTEFGTLVETADGSWTVRHAGHGQDFHSSEGARFEAWQLYVVASGLMERLKKDPHHAVAILDVGMGLAYNACATIAAWLQSLDPPSLVMVSLEIDPRLVEALAQGHAPWTIGWEQSWIFSLSRLQKLSVDRWSAEIQHPHSNQTLNWNILIGDASKIDMTNVKEEYASGGFQFVWQDPFTPELNPGMWSSEWFQKVLGAVASDATLMTYSVSRIVKDALESGGWQQERFRTPGKKRHWLRARPR